ncbi:type VI secretion system protein TssA [Pseudomonas sp. MB-090624]|uniref:type VI secretion system protein TssA n=1 Tax=Pseudomonas sp. MB-090624 TaxID=2213078 RepID=UPI000DA0D668|nr:type VI secretion system protein TssA [Pseudomonas sp. MB-090624]PYB94216.1 type VI secretion system protein TssA [Pseudomonas sp. MB-090624]
MSLSSLVASCLPDRDALALAREHSQCWEAWLSPISVDTPVGEDPGYDDDFQRMREEVNRLSGADVELVAQLGQRLLQHACKDLRVATYYLWARLHTDGEPGLADGLSLLAALLERYSADILPARPNSRKMALEWLAGNRVLASLSLYPQVVKAEAQRTVAALVWLEQAFSAWPEDQRPCLDGLYTALSARLAVAGGVDAIVPQTSSESAPTHSATRPSSSLIKSGRDLLDSGRQLATYLREQPEGWLAAHRLMKSLRWDTVHQVPPQDAQGITRLAPPRGEYRVQLKRLHVQQRWSELIDQAERMYAEGVNHFWLDLQWYLHQALNKSPHPHSSWAAVIKHDLNTLLQRLPGLETLYWRDGSAFADETTREWINQHVSDSRGAQWLPAAASATPMASCDILALEPEALAQADAEGVEQALAWLANRPDTQAGRQRWLLRLLMARVAEQYGKAELAIHLFTELDTTAHHHALTDWEPELIFEVKARLLKLLRLKAQRNDADRPALARRMERQLATLVAIDPVRAAVLCS